MTVEIGVGVASPGILGDSCTAMTVCVGGWWPIMASGGSSFVDGDGGDDDFRHASLRLGEAPPPVAVMHLGGLFIVALIIWR